MDKLKGHKQYLYASTIIIALGITFTTIMKDPIGSIGIIFIMIGGLFFIVGMNKKRKEYEQNNK